MIKGNRQHVVLDLLPNLKWARSSAYFGEPLVQMTTPQVAQNCLIYCPPSGNEFDNSAPQLSLSKNNQLIRASIQHSAQGTLKCAALWSKQLGLENGRNLTDKNDLREFTDMFEHETKFGCLRCADPGARHAS